MATATKPKAAKGFAPLSCPFCGASDDNTLNLDMMDLSRIVCGGCDEEFSPREALAKATATFTRWQRAVAWIEAAGNYANGRV